MKQVLPYLNFDGTCREAMEFYKTVFGGKKGMPIQKITDGTSNTIMIVEADDSRAVYWTQPEDYKIDANNPKAGLGRPSQP